jgi:hypothetical protein
MNLRVRAAVVLVIFTSLAAPRSARATGHGPAYGLATPTLPEGALSLDLAAMARVESGGLQEAMFRPMLGYGITEDLEVSFSAPLPLYSRTGAPTARMMGMMPATMDVEALVAWRFHRTDAGIGSRFESTALFGLDYPTGRVNGIDAAPGFSAGAVTGYVSRSIYLWAGALYRRYVTAAGADHPGDQLLYSAVVGWRPGLFRRELPNSDWRLFVEAVGEVTARDRVSGRSVADSGGHQIFIGPTVLGLFGPWGISGGPLFRVHADVNGTQPQDIVRFVANYTRWF